MHIMPVHCFPPILKARHSINDYLFCIESILQLSAGLRHKGDKVTATSRSQTGKHAVLATQELNPELLFLK